MATVSLKEKSSLDISLKGNKLVFGESLKQTEPEVRTIEQMKQVLMDPSVSEPKECYYMYREICVGEDKEIIEKSGLRYDLTVIPSLMRGKEYNKTFGHFHPEAGKGLSYPEIYEVLHGRAHYVLQSKDNMRFVVFEAAAGDKVLIPPNYGHITINPGKECLVMSNWVFSGFESEYSRIKENHGAIYYETEEGWTKNNSYREEPKIEFAKPRELPELGLEKNKPMYGLVKDIDKLSFLREPSINPKIFESLF